MIFCAGRRSQANKVRAKHFLTIVWMVVANVVLPEVDVVTDIINALDFRSR